LAAIAKPAIHGCIASERRPCPQGLGLQRHGAVCRSPEEAALLQL